MAETAREWILRVFDSIIENGNIIMAKGYAKVGKKKQQQPTGAKLFVSVENFEKLFHDDIEAGGSDSGIAAAIAAKTVLRTQKNPETGEDEQVEVELGYRKLIEDMTEKGLFG